MYIRVSNTKQEIVVYLIALVAVFIMMVGFTPANNDIKQVSRVTNSILKNEDGNNFIVSFDGGDIINHRHTDNNHLYSLYIYRCQVNIGIR